MKKSTDQPAIQEKSTVLAVSGCAEDLLTLQRMLDSGEWQVEQAGSCDEAMRCLRNGSPSVVACDHSLPDGGWQDLFQLATSLENPPAFVILSRHADETLWAEVLNVGGYDVLAKPFEHAEVSRVVEMACRHGRNPNPR